MGQEAPGASWVLKHPSLRAIVGRIRARQQRGADGDRVRARIRERDLLSRRRVDGLTVETDADIHGERHVDIRIVDRVSRHEMRDDRLRRHEQGTHRGRERERSRHVRDRMKVSCSQRIWRGDDRRRIDGDRSVRHA